jgi:hypothetical protein
VEFNSKNLNIKFTSKSKYGEYIHTGYIIIYDNIIIGKATYKTKSAEKYLSSDEVLVVEFNKDNIAFTSTNEIYSKIKKAKAVDDINWIKNYIIDILS